MGREVLPLTVDRLADLPGSCADCVFWELGPALIRRGRRLPRAEGGLADGDLARVGRRRAGSSTSTTAAPATSRMPRRISCPGRSPSPLRRSAADAVVLVTARIDPEFAGQGLGRVLVQAAAKDALRRAPGRWRRTGRPTPGTASCPADFLSAVGFRTAREHRPTRGCASTCGPPCGGAERSSRRSSGCSRRCGGSGRLSPPGRPTETARTPPEPGALSALAQPPVSPRGRRGPGAGRPDGALRCCWCPVHRGRGAGGPRRRPRRCRRGRTPGATAWRRRGC